MSHPITAFPIMRWIRNVIRGHRPVWIEFRPRPKSRWGYGRPPHPELARIIGEGAPSSRKAVAEILKCADLLAAIPLSGDPASSEPYWVNGFLPGLDAAVLYALVASRRPRRYVEIGSGHSTRFAARAIRDHQLATRIHCFDPAPRAAVEGLADEIHRTCLEDLAPGELASLLEPGDMLFFDGSHLALQNSDATVFFLEVLPSLPPGILIQVHDICLPNDYPPSWTDRWYSEQYLLAAHLLGGGAGTRLVCSNTLASEDPECRAILEPLWSRPSLAGVERRGSSFWLQTTPRDGGPGVQPGGH
jgi:hypothetical protein